MTSPAPMRPLIVSIPDLCRHEKPICSTQASRARRPRLPQCSEGRLGLASTINAAAAARMTSSIHDVLQRVTTSSDRRSCLLRYSLFS